MGTSYGEGEPQRCIDSSCMHTIRISYSNKSFPDSSNIGKSGNLSGPGSYYYKREKNTKMSIVHQPNNRSISAKWRVSTTIIGCCQSLDHRDNRLPRVYVHCP